MKLDLPEGIMYAENFLNIEEFSIICEVDKDVIIEMVEIGILEPKGDAMDDWQFSLFNMLRVKKARRLQHDLKLNLAGAALGLELLDEMKALRQQVEHLEHRLKLLSHL